MVNWFCDAFLGWGDLSAGCSASEDDTRTWWQSQVKRCGLNTVIRWLLVLNIAFCYRSLVVFNPTEQLRTSVISVVVDSPDARVVDAKTGRPMAAQISAVWAEPSRVSAEAFQVKTESIINLLISTDCFYLLCLFLCQALLHCWNSTSVPGRVSCDQSLSWLHPQGPLQHSSSWQLTDHTVWALPGVSPGRKGGQHPSDFEQQAPSDMELPRHWPSTGLTLQNKSLSHLVFRNF